MNNLSNQPPELPKKKFSKKKGIIGCVGAFLLFNFIPVIVAIVVALVPDYSEVEFSKNRDEILSNVRGAIEEDDYQKVLDFGKQYPRVTDSEFLKLLEIAENETARIKFKRNRHQIISDISQAIQGGDYRRALSIASKYEVVDDPQFLNLITKAKSELKEKTRIAKEAAAKAREEKGKIVPFQVVRFEDTSMGGRRRWTWVIIPEGNFRPQDGRATAIEVAKAMTADQFKTKVATVRVVMHKDSNEYLGSVDYIPDGYGYAGQRLGGKKGMSWHVGDFLNSIPTEDEVIATALVHQKHDSFANMDKNSPDFMSLNEQALLQSIADEMKKPVEEVEELIFMFHFGSRQDVKNKLPNYKNYKGEQYRFAPGFSKERFDQKIGEASKLVDKAYKDEFLSYLVRNELTGVVDDVGVNGLNLVIAVANPWHYEPKQIRLIVAQQFWKEWKRIASPSVQDSARIKIVDGNGNKVGGSGFAGSLIKVID